MLKLCLSVFFFSLTWIMVLRKMHVVHIGTTLSKPLEAVCMILQVSGLHSRPAEPEISSGEAAEICIVPDFLIVSCA